MFFRKKLKKITPEEESEFRENIHKENITFKDKMAMILSAYVVIVLPCLIVLILLSLLAMFLVGVL